MSSSDVITTLTFTPDNPCNTTITSASGEVLFSVVTEHTKKSTFTQVRDAQDEVMGSLEWRDVLSDRVTIKHGRPVALSDWMKKSMLPFKDHASFSDDQGRKYRWKGISSGRSMELYTEEDKFTTPIARYHRTRRIPATAVGSEAEKANFNPMASMYSLTPTLTDTKSITATLADDRSETATISPSTQPPQYIRTPGQLALLPRAREIEDLVVLSVLFLEIQRRLQNGGRTDNNAMLGSRTQSLTFATAC